MDQPGKNASLAKDTPQAIIDGVLSVMAKEGIANLTTKLVSKRAGVSTASIHYFFDTKDALIYQAFLYMVRTLREETIAIRRAETDPLKRIARSLEVHFSPFHFMADISIIWPQFWAYSGADQSVARLMHIFSIRMISNSTADLRALGYGRGAARMKAIELSALQRGLWIERRLALSVEQDECWQILEMALAAIAKETGRTAPTFKAQAAGRPVSSTDAQQGGVIHDQSNK
ncbi:TetR family transcriptional regulator [Maritalea mediterranea]|uniref:TetR family transcriptional regulator n=1 Tax=Maritalea mediterranea TaxID=2909667 RepID=A0ABS9EAH8_9HYPH|nr:TetR family transcriptional regulator [Maritalea mediterranea]MCF4098446.1 TetR family transcriptional regulator [Maritalea mediterranea]